MLDINVSEDNATSISRVKWSGDGSRKVHKTLISYHITAQCQNSQDHDLTLHHNENLKPHNS